MEDRPLLKEQYKLAIDARDKLNDDFHKWMTYYYVANGAVLVAVMALFSEAKDDFGLIGLGVLGMVISMFWNLSCKGYYYWSLNWIKIIKRFEKLLFTDLELQHFGVYSLFSKEVAVNTECFLIPNKPANISTPKLTMMFSFLSILGWLSYSLYRFICCYAECSSQCKCLVVVLFLLLVLVLYTIALPNWAKSREEGHHELV